MSAYPEIDPNNPVLTISPAELNIPLRLNTDIVVELKLTNLTPLRAAYKIKTTAPDRYQVRPIQAIVPPKSTIVCMIVLKPISKMPSEDDMKNLKHKFLVQSATIPDGEEITDETLPDFWKLLENEKKKGINKYHDTRIVSTLLVPQGTQECASCEELRTQLTNKTTEFENLMQFGVKQANQIKTFTNQLVQKDKDYEALKRTNADLEKELMNLQRQQVIAPKPAVVADDNDKNVPIYMKHQKIPTYLLAVILLVGIILGYVLKPSHAPSITP